MAIFEDAMDAARDRVNDNLASINANWSPDDVAWPGSKNEMSRKTSFMVLDVAFENRDQAALGGGLTRVDGTVDFMVVHRKGVANIDGVKKIQQWLDNLAALFPLGLTVAANGSTLRFKAPVPEPLGEDQDYAFAGLSCPFFAYVTS